MARSFRKEIKAPDSFQVTVQKVLAWYRTNEKVVLVTAGALIIAIGRPGDYSKELDYIIQKNNLREYLINFGQIENSKIQKFYQISDLFLMPSRGEGFPRVMLEAMACKCPPLAFDVGGVSEIMSKNMHHNLLVTLDDSKSFIEKAIDAISNDQLLTKLSNMSYSKVQNYSTENIVQMYIGALKNV